MKRLKKAGKGFFITLEGCEGSGKTTHSNILAGYLRKSGFTVIQTREPGGTAFAESLRKLLLDPKNKITPLAELFLYEAARAQHISDVIAPALKKGAAVVCDRFTDATLAYQGYGRGLDTGIIKELNAAATCGISPALTLYLDIPAGEGLKKARKRGLSDRIEGEKLAFHKRVRRGYLALAGKEPRRIKVIKIRKSIEGTARLIELAVTKALNSWHLKI